MTRTTLADLLVFTGVALVIPILLVWTEDRLPIHPETFEPILRVPLASLFFCCPSGVGRPRITLWVTWYVRTSSAQGRFVHLPRWF